MIALTPVREASLILEMGDLSNAMMGNKYAKVFPVPVGEMAAKSRPYRFQ